MNKYIYIFIAMAALIAAGSACSCDFMNSYPRDVIPNYYEDNIMMIYNSSWIETANYQFVKVNNTHELNITLGEKLIDFNGSNIIVSEKKRLGPKSLLADVFILSTTKHPNW